MMKRVFDVVLVGLTAPLWIPVVALVALAVLVCDGRPVFYASDRAGKGGRVFRFLKFRTMRPKRGGSAADDADFARLTRLGRCLRRASLDELPQLFHVLSGKMSLVGPRPLPAAYLPRYTPFAARRHEVRPGITGWAQVNGRNALSWEEKFALDVWYIEHRTLALDLEILFRTFGSAVRGTGTNHSEYDTMYEYQGG